jgi:apolipoprotein N-acyltransferase
LQEKLLSASRVQARSGAKIIVWSEGNALVFKTDEAAFVARGQALARAEGVYLFMAMAVMTPGDKLAVNKLTVITPTGAVAGSYLKSHPAPGEASVAGKNEMGVMDTPYGRLAWAICYDFDFPAFIRQAGQKSADILIDPSWEGANMAPLHSHMAAFRAVENGAALIRIVNGGVSLAVDRNGRIRSQLDQTHSATTETIMLADLPVHGKPTLYGRFGDWMGMASAALLAGLLWLGFMRRI